MSNKMDECLEGIHRMELTLVKIQADVEVNTDDLTTHIQRTDLLDKKLSRIYIVAYVGLGILVSEFGPNVLKILGVL